MPILAVIGGWVARLLAVGGVRAVLWKGIAYALVTVVLPAVLYKLQSEILGEVLTAIGTQVSSGGAPLSLQLTGLLGWFATAVRVPDCFALIMSGLVARWTKTLALTAAGGVRIK